MKKLFICLVLLVTSFTFSQENTAHLEDAIQLMKMSNASIEVSIAPIVAQIPEANKEAFKKELQPILDNMYESLAKVAVKEYSHEDIKAIKEFYETDLGKTMIKGQVKLIQASMQIGQQFSMQLMPIMQKYMSEK